MNIFGLFGKHSEQQKTNKAVIDALIKAGEKIDEEHLIELAFFGTWKRMSLLKNELLGKGYEEIVGQTDKMLIVSKMFKLNFDLINNLTEKMEQLAKKYDVEFDGWSTYPTTKIKNRKANS